MAFRRLILLHPIDHFTGRRLSLQSCVPPPVGQPDNIEVLPSSELQNLERNSGSTGTVSDDDRASKRQRGTLEQLRVVPDSLESPYLHNSLLDIEELMK